MAELYSACEKADIGFVKEKIPASAEDAIAIAAIAKIVTGKMGAEFDKNGQDKKLNKLIENYKNLENIVIADIQASQKKASGLPYPLDWFASSNTQAIKDVINDTALCALELTGQSLPKNKPKPNTSRDF
jgi:hypothetical protein